MFCSPFFPGGEAGSLEAAVPQTKGWAPEEEPGTGRTHQGLLQPQNCSHRWDCVTQTGELERKPALFASRRGDGSQQVLEELWGWTLPGAAPLVGGSYAYRTLTRREKRTQSALSLMGVLVGCLKG